MKVRTYKEEGAGGSVAPPARSSAGAFGALIHCNHRYNRTSIDHVSHAHGRLRLDNK